MTDQEGREGFFFDSKTHGLVISRSYGRVKPASVFGGQASPLRCSRSSLNKINFMGATAAFADCLELLDCRIGEDRARGSPHSVSP